MRVHLVVTITAATVFLPAAAPAAAANFRVLLNVEHVEVVPRSEDQTVFLDVYVTDLDNVNERLTAAAVLLRGPSNTPDGVRFTSREWLALPSDAHPYAFRNTAADPPYAVIADFSLVGGFAGSAQVPIDGINVSESRSGLFSIEVLVPAGTAPGVYPVVIDPAFTAFGSFGPNIDPVIGPPGGVTVVPEPAAIIIPMALAVLPLLRRRRRQ